MVSKIDNSWFAGSFFHGSSISSAIVFGVTGYCCFGSQELNFVVKPNIIENNGNETLKSGNPIIIKEENNGINQILRQHPQFNVSDQNTEYRKIP